MSNFAESDTGIFHDFGVPTHPHETKQPYSLQALRELAQRLEKKHGSRHDGRPENRKPKSLSADKTSVEIPTYPVEKLLESITSTTQEFISQNQHLLNTPDPYNIPLDSYVENLVTTFEPQIQETTTIEQLRDTTERLAILVPQRCFDNLPERLQTLFQGIENKRTQLCPPKHTAQDIIKSFKLPYVHQNLKTKVTIEKLASNRTIFEISDQILEIHPITPSIAFYSTNIFNAIHLMSITQWPRLSTFCYQWPVHHQGGKINTGAALSSMGISTVKTSRGVNLTVINPLSIYKIIEDGKFTPVPVLPPQTIASSLYVPLENIWNDALDIKITSHRKTEIVYQVTQAIHSVLKPHLNFSTPPIAMSEWGEIYLLAGLATEYNKHLQEYFETKRRRKRAKLEIT